MQHLSVVGHINPDTDTTCSAIAAAHIFTANGQEAQAFATGQLNKETQYVLEHFGIATPPLLERFSEGQQVVLVDTNNPEELLPGWNEADIVEVIDHHKLAGLSTAGPIAVTIRPVACTCTLLFQLAKERGVTLPKDIAGIMLAAILSDTLKFTSPTTMEEDKVAAAELTTLAGVSVDTLADGMFDAKSDLTGMSIQDLLTVDSKVFTLGGRKMRVSVLETTKPEKALALKEEILTTMQSMKSAEELDGALFFIVDIIQNSSTLIVPSEEEVTLAEKAFGVTAENNLLILPGVVSRKKQMVPKLEAVA